MTSATNESESNPLLGDWAQAMGSKPGLELLGEKLRGSSDHGSAIPEALGADWPQARVFNSEAVLERASELAMESAWEYCSSDGY